MARRKISEFRAKTILSKALGVDYVGLSLHATDEWQAKLAKLPEDDRYVVKVDQGIKGRFKKGLVKLDRSSADLSSDIKELAAKGFEYFLIEPYRAHAAASECYLAMEIERDGDMVTLSGHGGVDVESHAGTLKSEAFSPDMAESRDKEIGLPAGTIATLHKAFVANYFSFVEINPLIVRDGRVELLDAAIEVDEEAASFVGERWTAGDFRGLRSNTEQEEAVEELAAQSQASFRLEVLNPDGQVFLLLSGGGASVVLADEVHNQGYGKELGNYGEYSGNPNEQETYLYSKQIISLMTQSKAARKVLVIGGGVANFTDVRVTFRGVIRALDEAKADIKAQKIRVFVRRGGPFEVEGLSMIGEFLRKEDLFGLVAGPELMLAEIVPTAIATLERDK